MSATKKVAIKPPEQVHENDKAKKIYRSVCEIIKRLDSVQSKKTGFRDAFLPEVIFLRDRLQEYCEKLMFSWPLEYGRKAEEVIWRKGFYDVIQLVKKNIKEVKIDGGIEKAFKTHLSSALGYYTRLLLRIQSKFAVHAGDVIDLGIMFGINKGEDNLFQNMKPETKAIIRNWANQACFRSLVYLGDIARYQYEYDGTSKMIAQRYYHQALRLCPTIGMPYNQLGTLAGMNAYGFHAAYYYIRCLISLNPFEGTNNNLLKLFERNRKKLLELEATDDSNHQRLLHNFHYRHPRKNALSYARSKDSKRFLLRFIQLIEIFFMGPKDCDKTQVYELCQVVLDDFDACLSNLKSKCTGSLKRDRGIPSEEKQSTIDDDVIFKIFVMCLASIYHLSRKGHDLMAAAIAFSLAMYSHALNFVITRLQPSTEIADDMDQEESYSKLKMRQPRKYTIQRMVDSNVSKIMEENHSNVGGDDDGGGDCGNNPGNSSRSLENDVDQDKDFSESNSVEKVQCDEEKGKKKNIINFASRKRTKGSDDDHEDDNDGDDLNEDESGEDNDEDNLSSEVESEGALSDFDLLSSSDEGSGMESQPEDDDQEPGERVIRVPAYHKKADVNSTIRKVQIDKQPTRNKEIERESKNVIANEITDDVIDDDKRDGLKNKPAVKIDDSSKCSDANSNILSDNWKNGPNLDEASGSWMSDAAVFLGKTLKMSYFEGDGTQDLTDILSGSKNVPVPPGFEKSLELQHVMEITEKLANFNIETDTDVNQSDADDMGGDQNSDDDAGVKMEKKQQEMHKKEVARILNIVTSERILEHVKIFIEWMTINPLIVNSCAKISSSIWYRMTSLLNLLPTERDVLESDMCTKNKNFANILRKELRNGTDSACQVFPMTEDIHLLEFPPLNVAHQRLNFDLEEFINDKQEAIVRLCRIRMFCRFLSTLQGIEFDYDHDADAFRGPVVNPTSSKSKTGDNKETDRAILMRNLAQLRVRSQSGKERSIVDLVLHGFPMYLVPDAESIYEGLKMMKKFVQHEKLRIVVPKVVLAFLDSIKTTNSITMKALEWVEEEVYRNDHSHIRIQKPHETSSTSETKHNSKDDYILEIIDCCLYLLTSSTSPGKELPPDSQDLNSVCLLTWMTVDNPELSEKSKNALEGAIKKGIKVKSVTEFFHQWQQLSSNIL